MDLVRDDDRELLEPIRPVPQEGVGPLRGRDDHVELLEGRIDGIVVADTDADLDSEWFELLEVLVLLRREGAQRDDVKGLPFSEDGGEDREIRDERLAARGGDREDQILAEERRADRIDLRRGEVFSSPAPPDFHYPRSPSPIPEPRSTSDCTRASIKSS